MPELQFDSHLSRLHSAIIRSMLDNGACPSTQTLAQSLALSSDEIVTLMSALSEIHALVLHPHRCAPWIVHPFSLTPTLNWVEGEGRGWWAPCIWCGFGVAALAGGAVTIHTRVGAESEPLLIEVVDGEPAAGAGDLVVHFAIPPARAWDNVHEHCALVLPFRSADDIAPWCERHNIPQGEAVPIKQVASLARKWYSAYADPEWRKWTVPEAQQIFNDVGLTSSFWDLGTKSGRF